MSGTFVRVESPEDGIRLVTVDRPEKLNALNAAVLEDLTGAIAAAESEPTLRCLILTGSGEKAFIAGADIGELAKLTPIEGRPMSAKGRTAMAETSCAGDGPCPSFANA